MARARLPAVPREPGQPRADEQQHNRQQERQVVVDAGQCTGDPPEGGREQNDAHVQNRLDARPLLWVDGEHDQLVDQRADRSKRARLDKDTQNKDDVALLRGQDQQDLGERKRQKTDHHGPLEMHFTHARHHKKEEAQHNGRLNKGEDGEILRRHIQLLRHENRPEAAVDHPDDGDDQHDAAGVESRWPAQDILHDAVIFAQHRKDALAVRLRHPHFALPRFNRHQIGEHGLERKHHGGKEIEHLHCRHQRVARHQDAGHRRHKTGGLIGDVNPGVDFH